MALTSAAYREALDRLNPAQRRAVDLVDGPVLVLAGPGTGKTQILAARIGRILETTDADPSNILCLTYTEAGATAMRARLIQFIGPQAHKVSIHTFHGFCNRVIQENKEIFNLDDLDPVSELESAEFIRKIIDELDWDHPLRRRKMRYYDVNSLRSFFDELKKEGMNSEDYLLSMNAFEASIGENPDNLYKLGTRVNKSFIRVESDEVTYPLHIILRFNLERKIFNNEINIADIPDAWNDEFNRLFNLSINKDTDGCLQDIHWFAGLFGYFPTYSLGALTAAQFASQLRTDQKELDKEIENGEFSNLVNWLKKNIHEKASFFSTNEVLEQVTKSPLNAKYFKEYITNRYL